MKYIIIILLLFSLNESKSQSRDINVYGTFPGYTFGYEFDIEYCLFKTNIIGIKSKTYLKYGASIFGFYDLVVSQSYPIIGFIQYFGEEEGLDIGANYFKNYNKNLFDKSFSREQRVPSVNDYEAIGFELGYRYYNDNVVYRFTYTPSYILTSEHKYGNQILHLLGFSLGYSF